MSMRSRILQNSVAAAQRRVNVSLTVFRDDALKSAPYHQPTSEMSSAGSKTDAGGQYDL